MKDVCECRRMRTSVSTHLKTGWSESISEETFMPRHLLCLGRKAMTNLDSVLKS